AFLICAVLILATAYGQGADPLHPRTRHIWALSLVAAAYVSLRGSLIIEKLTSKDDSSKASKSMFGQLVSRRKHSIDDRMDARRQRVAAAKANQSRVSEPAPSDRLGDTES
ncbi:MAG: hypothetical protein AAFO63_09965, partial [Pseudomonadota bacterium]